MHVVEIQQTYLYLVLSAGHWLQYPICYDIIHSTHNWGIIRKYPSRKYHGLHAFMGNAC